MSEEVDRGYPAPPHVEVVSSKGHDDPMHISTREEDLIIIYVRPGSQFQALTYLIRQVNNHFHMDDVPPEVPEKYRDYCYEVLRWPEHHVIAGEAIGSNPYGDAKSFFLKSTWPSKLILRRVKKTTGSLIHSQSRQTEKEEEEEENSSFFCRAEEQGTSKKQIMAIRRLAGMARQFKPPVLQALVPLAIPGNRHYLRMAAESVISFNNPRKGIFLTPYMDETCLRVSAAVKIQACWRSHSIRRRANLKEQIRIRMAVICIQRSWRMCESCCP